MNNYILKTTRAETTKFVRNVHNHSAEVNGILGYMLQKKVSSIFSISICMNIYISETTRAGTTKFAGNVYNYCRELNFILEYTEEGISEKVNLLHFCLYEHLDLGKNKSWDYQILQIMRIMTA